VTITRRDLIKKFRNLGFIGPYSGGKHMFMSKGGLKIRVPNPHGPIDISDSLLPEILRQANVTKEEWNNS